MRYFTALEGQTKHDELEITELAKDRFEVTWRGKRWEVDALTLSHGAVSLIANGESYGVEFEEIADKVQVTVRGQAITIDIADERRLRMRAASGKFSVEGKQVIAAPMPGKIVRVLVKVGDEVKEGQGLVVVEAMKMENELKAPKAGKVTELVVKEGQAVESGAKLVVVE